MTKRIEVVLCALAGGALGLCASAAEISTEKICGLFIDGEEPLFAVKAAVGSTWKATDWRGRTVEEGSVTETVKPPVPDRGYYLLTVTEPNGVVTRHSYFRVPDPKTRRMDQQSFYAIDSAFSGLSHSGRFACPWLGGDTYKMVAELHRYAGLPHTRERMEWKREQPAADAVPEFRTRLKNARLLAETGVSISGMYQKAPKWAGARFSLASDLLATYRFSEACAREFGELVEAWEFDNEEDGGHSPEPAWEFASAFKAASLGFHAGRKETLVLQGAFSQRKVIPYHQVMFENDIGKYLDVFNYHHYGALKNYESVLNEFRTFLNRHDRPGREIWITENGTDAEGHCEAEGVGNRQHAPWQELIVAEFYPKSQALLQMAGVRRSYLFTLCAYNERGGAKDWGVMRRDGTLKPVFAAISTMTDELGAAPIEGEVLVGDDARGFLFSCPDGTKTLLAWRTSDIETTDHLVVDRSASAREYMLNMPAGEYCVVDMCGARRTVRADEQGLKLALDRYPVYVRGVKRLAVTRSALPCGTQGPAPADGEDLTVVLQVIHERKDFSVASGQATLLVEKEVGAMTVNVWNLSDRPKTGRVTVEGAVLRGLPEKIDLPAFGKVELPVTLVNDDAFLANPAGTLMVLGGTFDGRKISRTALRIEDTMRAVRDSRKVVLAADDPANWQRNTSADDFTCERNEQEGGVRMRNAWKSSFSNRWIYPRYVLQLGEDASRATILEFEVRSRQNKVENDYSMSALMLGFDGTDEGDWLKFEHPSEVWEKRRFNLAPILAANKGRKLTSFRIGGNPRGTEVDYFIRNVTLYVAKPASATFAKARPVWPAGETETLNTFFTFRCEFRAAAGDDVRLRATAGYIYKARLNGAFAAFGPARVNPGFFRVDDWKLTPREGANVLEVDVAGYNCPNFYLAKQMPFLQAEVCVNGRVVAATGNEGFAAFTTGKLRKTPRYAYQRPYSEVYRLPFSAKPAGAVEVQPPKKLLPREWAYPTFACVKSSPLSRERTHRDDAMKPVVPRFIEGGLGNFVYFPPDELEDNPFFEMQRRKTVSREPVVAPPDGRYALNDGEGVVFALDRVYGGFPALTVRVESPTTIYLTHDEVLQEDGAVDFLRTDTMATLAWHLDAPGDYSLESFEPYGFKYVRILSAGGRATVSAPMLRTYESPSASRASFKSSDPALEKIFAAARGSYVANAVDCLTDCPNRERGGWLGDSFFTGRASQWLTGTGFNEKLFLQNFSRPDTFPAPARYQGLVPAIWPCDLMCRECFIPTYDMWLIGEIEACVARNGYSDLKEQFRPKVFGILDFLKKYVNDYGLLQHLPGWVFIEWSKANELVYDVNYPSNMLYAWALDAAARLYERDDFAAEALRIRDQVRRESYNGKWFCDNAVVKDRVGFLGPSGQCTEVCQYFAFFTGTATPESHPDLYRTLLADFGPNRLKKGLHPEVAPANFLFGTLLRMEILSRARRSRQMYDELRDYFLYMAEKTGTLWENDKPLASCCHGFASIAAAYLYRDILGVRQIDYRGKRIWVDPPADMPLEWCEGIVPVSAAEEVYVRWQKVSGVPEATVDVPEGWIVVK